MQKIEHLIGLDRSYEILSWSPDAFDPVRLSMKSQVIRIILSICTKAMLEGKLGRDATRERNRDSVLKELASYSARQQGDGSDARLLDSVRGKPGHRACRVEISQALGNCA